jgi:hypothetical protein
LGHGFSYTFTAGNRGADALSITLRTVPSQMANVADTTSAVGAHQSAAVTPARAALLSVSLACSQSDFSTGHTIDARVMAKDTTTPSIAVSQTDDVILG